MNRKQLINTLLLVFTAFIWGCAFVAQSVGSEHVGAFTFLAARSWLGSAVLIPVIVGLDFRAKKRHEPPRAPQKATQKRTLYLGGLCCGAFLFFASYAQQLGMASTTTAKGGFITALYVVMVPVISLLFGRKTGAKTWLCVVMSVVGLYLLCLTDGLHISSGDALVLLCALLFSGQILAIDYFSPKVDALRLSFLQFLTVALLSTGCMFIFETPRWEDISAAALPILYAGILSSGVGYTLQMVAQKGLDPTVASLSMSLESVFSALAGWVILQQTMQFREFAGCLLMFAAIILAQLPIGKKRSKDNRK